MYSSNIHLIHLCLHIIGSDERGLFKVKDNGLEDASFMTLYRTPRSNATIDHDPYTEFFDWPALFRKY